jgi:hypothetical protein
MLLYQLAVITGFVLDKWLLGEFISFLFTIEFLFTKLIAMTLVFIELVSIDENFRELTGKNLFKSFKQMITRASDIKDDINKL